LQCVQGNPVKEWPERNHDEQQKRKTGKGTECCRAPTADRGDREHNRKGFDSFDE
jgi:hypothetical protein